MFNNVRKTALAMVVIGMGVSVQAVASDDSYVREINNRKANLELIRAQIEEAKALSDLAQLQYRIAEEDKRVNDEAAKAAEPEKKVEAPTVVEKAAPPTPAPRLVAIFGKEGDLMASIRYASGVMADVRVGDRLEGDFRVKSITPNRVVLTRNGQSVTLRSYTGGPIGMPSGAGDPGPTGPGRSISAF